VRLANRAPDHATIARFRARHEQALAATFTQVLTLCARAGLVSVGVVALDGSLITGNAPPGAKRSYEAIRPEVDAMLEQAAHNQLAPMVDHAVTELARAGLQEPIGHRPRRRRLLELRPDQRGAHATHPGPRPDQEPQTRQAADSLTPPG
jgi:hypothetical protein